MKELPKKWCIKNDYQEVRDYLAEKYNIPDIKNWTYKYIGYDGCTSNRGVHGCPLNCFPPETVQITIEDFKKLVLKEETMNKLPDGYIVRCYNQEECRDVYKNFYNDGFEPSHWNYIVCSSLIKHAQFEEEGKLNSGYIIIHNLSSLNPRLKKLPVFEYTEYVKLREETMTKQDFTIEGSEALKKAFVEESGLTNSAIIWANYLTSSLGEKALTSQSIKESKHFILPSQWEEALQYVKEYFAEDEFKIGDWVVVTSLECNNDSIKYPIGLVAQISKKQYHTQQCYSRKNDWWTWLEFNGVLISPYNAVASSCLRKATPEEITTAQTKTFKLGNFTAVVSKDKVTIADRGSVTISECIKWFEEEFTIGDEYSSLGEFAVTENTYTLNLGCVKNVPVKDIEEVYKYLKTL